MPSICLQKPLIKSYEQLLSFKIRLFQSFFPRGKRLEISKFGNLRAISPTENVRKSIDGKCFSAPRSLVNFSNLKSRSTPLGKRVGKFITGKGLSVPQELSDFSKKNVSKTKGFSYKILEKYIKPKITLNFARGKRLENSKFGYSRAISPAGNGLKIS